ncbi:MAG: HRDC domain-containing protein [Acidimicrobiia bacterium]|nr:HRDC domain-containing protein [Acidimicrobiia bacterium]
MSPEPATAHRPVLVDEESALEDVLAELATAEVYAIDTEFHRERTYYPKLALVQIAWAGGLVLIDPLAVDARRLGPLLESDALAVVHASDQDLEVLDHACGAIPARMFDTQIAAGFLGMSSPSLSSLCERFVSVRIPKAERLTDWLARPLADRQLDYAASDVAHLLEVHRREVAQLEARDRLGWVENECELVRLRPRGNRKPEDAWRRIKEARQLRGQARAIATEVAAWRERRAAEVDQPPRFVLPDLAVVAISQRAPSTLADLRSVRSVDARHAKGATGEALLAAVAAGKAAPPPASSEEGPELDRALRPAVTLVSAWVSQLARDIEIDTALLATRNDVEELLAGVEGARLAEGWRSHLVGEPIRALVAGEAALAFVGEGRIDLEQRSGTPLRSSA